jgi:hypothetical protein
LNTGKILNSYFVSYIAQLPQFKTYDLMMAW